MFERYTERARQVVILAQDEAREMEHGYVGLDHILLGLLREEEGLAAKVLDSLGVTYEGTRTIVEYTGGYGETDATESDKVPFTPRAKKALEMALREALSLGHNYIGTEHILLGLVREGTDLLNSQEVRDATLRMLRGPSPASITGQPRVPDQEPPERIYSTFCLACATGQPHVHEIEPTESWIPDPEELDTVRADLAGFYPIKTPEAIREGIDSRRPRNGERRGGAGFPKFFKMIRPNDESGVSGTGWIMSGVEWPNGWVQTFWNTKDKPSSSGFYETMDAFLSIHVSSHPGNKTIIEWYDVDATTARPDHRIA
jgi:hypothetical protein